MEESYSREIILNKNKVGKVVLLNFKTCSSTVIIKAVWD